MATTEIDICNIALGRVGVDRTIISFEEQSKEARNCKRFYELARDEVMEKVPWPFATRTVALAPLPVGDLLPGWGFQYALPADMASLLEVVPAGEAAASVGYYQDCCGPWNPPRSGMYSFRRAMSADGTVGAVLSNVRDAYAVYVSKATNTSLFSTLCVSAIADRLAMELAMPLTSDPRWFQVAQQRFQLSFMEAASRSFEQSKDGPDALPPSIRARG